MFNDKTIYTIHDENDDNTTVSIDKFVADTLQNKLPNVHRWIQDIFIKVTLIHPDISRRQRGNIVRELAFREAEKYPDYYLLVNSSI